MLVHQCTVFNSLIYALRSWAALFVNLHANNASRTNITDELLINRCFKCHVQSDQSTCHQPSLQLKCLKKHLLLANQSSLYEERATILISSPAFLLLDTSLEREQKSTQVIMEEIQDFEAGKF